MVDWFVLKQPLCDVELERGAVSLKNAIALLSSEMLPRASRPTFDPNRPRVTNSVKFFRIIETNAPFI